MADYFGLDRLIAMTRDPNEVYFNLEPELYVSAKPDFLEKRKNKERLANADLLDTNSGDEINIEVGSHRP